MNKYIFINLNQSESKETRREIWREKSRWTIFGILVALLLYVNIDLWMLGRGYSYLIQRKESEISEVKQKISELRRQGKNLSKIDILSLADLEQNRILWAKNLQLIGKMMPEDMALTSIKYRRNKILIGGIAVVYEDRKDFNIVHGFIASLKRNSKLAQNFKNIKFNQGSLNTVRGQEIVEFEIEANVKVSGRNEKEKTL